MNRKEREHCCAVFETFEEKKKTNLSYLYSN